MDHCELAMNSTHVKLDHLDHVAFQVSNLSAALAWYRDLFSVKTLYEDKTWAMLSFENINLALVTQGEHPPHIALQRSDATSFGPLTRHREGTASVYIQDPTGNIVEILQNVEPSEEQNGF